MLRVVGGLALFATALMAQEFRATLQGTVQDQTQAVVPSAEVVLRNSGTSVERRTTTDTAGHYLFQFLPPGRYSLTTKAPGFKTDVRDGIQLSLSENVRLDIALALGQSAET